MIHQKTDFILAIEQHKGIFFKIAKLYFENEEDQADLRQEMIFQIWKSFNSFKGEAQISTWMYRIALNTAIFYFKIEKKRKLLNEAIDTANLNITDIPKEEDNKLQQLYRAIHQLDKIEKAVIFHYLEDKSHREIAQLLGISEANARVKMHRTKEKLKHILLTNKNLDYES